MSKRCHHYTYELQKIVYSASKTRKSLFHLIKFLSSILTCLHRLSKKKNIYSFGFRFYFSKIHKVQYIEESSTHSPMQGLLDITSYWLQQQGTLLKKKNCVQQKRCIAVEVRFIASYPHPTRLHHLIVVPWLMYVCAMMVLHCVLGTILLQLL